MKPSAQKRAAARLAAVQALYQLEMEGTPMASLLDEFHRHRLGAEIGRMGNRHVLPAQRIVAAEFEIRPQQAGQPGGYAPRF